MNMLGMGGFEMRQLDGMVYMKPPEDLRPPESPDAKPWIRVRADEAHKESGPSLLGAEEARDPARQLEYLRVLSDSPSRYR